MKQTAEQYLGEQVDSAVITVPAYFNDLKEMQQRMQVELRDWKLKELLMNLLRQRLHMVWIRNQKKSKMFLFLIWEVVHLIVLCLQLKMEYFK